MMACILPFFLAGAAFDSARIDEVLRSAVQRRDIPGVVAMVATPDAIVYHGAFGKRDVTQTVEMTEDTIFPIFSMTKPVTSVAAMQLLERGKLSLDRPVRNVLPAVAEAQVLVGFRNGEPQLRPPAQTITLRQLLTHTSGFAYSIWNKDLRQYEKKRGTDPTSVPGEGPLVFEPGSKWEYGTSVDVAGKMVETVSGLSLDEYFRRNIFEPLGMTETFFNVPVDRQSRIVSLHRRQPNGSLEETPRRPPVPATTFHGGGGLNSTASDYVKFMQMVLRGGGAQNARVLLPKTVALMTVNQIGSLQAGRMITAWPEVSNDVDFHPGSFHGFGFGFLINATAYEAGRSQGSLAWAGLANTYFWIDPERKLCAVILMQILPFFDTKAIAVVRDFERAVYAR